MRRWMAAPGDLVNRLYVEDEDEDLYRGLHQLYPSWWNKQRFQQSSFRLSTVNQHPGSLLLAHAILRDCFHSGSLADEFYKAVYWKHVAWWNWARGGSISERQLRHWINQEMNNRIVGNRLNIPRG